MISSIRTIIIPEKIGSYYLLKKRVLGVTITKTHIYATALTHSGATVTLTRFFKQALEGEASTPYDERVTATLKKIIAQAGPLEEVRLAISSTAIIFKELTVPFTERDKIASILPYEIESFLPFALSEATLDFIITKTDTAHQSADILVAAVQHDVRQRYLDYCPPTDGEYEVTLTVDIFDLYSLYSVVPTYANHQGARALIDIGFSHTTIAFIYNGQLTSVRTVSQGILSWAKQLSQTLNEPLNQTLEKIMRFGLEHAHDDSYTKHLNTLLTNFANEISFTLSAFAQRWAPSASLEQVILLGSGAQLNKMSNFLSEQLDAPVAMFDSDALLKIPGIRVLDNHHIPFENNLSVATAYVTPLTEGVNFAQSENSLQKSLLSKQIIVGCILLVTLLSLLIGNSIWSIRKLQQGIAASEKELTSYLRTAGLATSQNVITAVNQAEEKIAQQEEIWFAFSDQTRFSFIKYVEQLSTAIDRKGIGLKLSRLEINGKNNTLSLEGQVRDFDALKTFERELKESHMFVSVPSLQNTSFKLTDLALKNGQE